LALKTLKQDIDSKTGKKSKALRLADRLEKQEDKAAIEQN